MYKKAQAQQATPKAEKGTKVVNDFKAEMEKCGGKMKKKSAKKQTGGPIIEKDQNGNKMLNEKDWKRKLIVKLRLILRHMLKLILRAK